MSKQVLDIQQMQHLKELGVDTRTASLCWVCLLSEPYLSFYDKEYPQKDTKVIPSFTLQDILDLLPTEIEKENRNYQLEVFRNPQRYFVSYYWLDNLLISLNEVEFIDAAYEMLCWCVENGYVDTKK